MPCNDIHDPSDFYGGGLVSSATVSKLKKRLDRATRNLCSTCRKLESAGKLETYLDQDTQNWWEDHKAEDAKRIAKELAKQMAVNAKRTALSKLTPEERKLLGLDKRKI